MVFLTFKFVLQIGNSAQQDVKMWLVALSNINDSLVIAIPIYA